MSVHRQITAMTICAVAMFAGLSVWGQDFDLRSKPYDAARSSLTKSGFKPVALKHNNEDYFCVDGFCEKYPEAINCAGTGLSPCRFAYFSSEKKKYFIVDTHGEIRLTVTGAHWARDYEIEEIRRRQ